MNAIETEKMTFGYPHHQLLMREISLSFEESQFTAITGGNGAGKTTLGKLLAGILKPISGSVRLYGQDSTKMKLSEIGNRLCYCFQNPDNQLFTNSVEDEIGFALKYKGMNSDEIKAKVWEMAELFQLSHLMKSLPMKLSYGEKRRVVLAAGLVLEPAFLILDEPTPGLDQERIRILSEVLYRLKRKQIGAILISHDKKFVEDHADRIIVLSKGEIADDISRN